MNIFDPYEFRARVSPAILVSISPVITLMSSLALLQDSPDLILRLLGGSSVVVVFIYLLTFIVRKYGSDYESQLWKEWDGPPSTRFLRWRDPTFDDEMKKKLHNAVMRVCDIKLYSLKEEEEDPEAADTRISQAFMQVRAIVRKDDPKGLWLSHNSEYGFHRNLIGSRKPWVILTIVGTIICAGLWYLSCNVSLLYGFVLNSILLISTILLGWKFLPRSAEITANRYGESIWGSFLVWFNTSGWKK